MAKYDATAYLRLSYTADQSEESDSITNQKKLVEDFVAAHPDITLVNERVDDGYSGVLFDRPAFQEMMGEVKAGKINCIVVKDLSRFGRDHLDAGEYIERIFPFLGVSFIAINDHYDSLHSHAESDELIVPFKNLINEAYCRDISIKIRSQLEIKRKRGDFIGSFAVYGYLKDPEDKNHLVVDGYAADVVRDIFAMKLAGCSLKAIADRLNRDGILSPLQYKKSIGIRLESSFQKDMEPKWSYNAVLRISRSSGCGSLR